MKLTNELIFINRDEHGDEYHHPFPIGTKVREVSPTSDDPEIVECRLSVITKQRHGRGEFIAVIIDGKPRVIPKSAVGLATRSASHDHEGSGSHQESETARQLPMPAASTAPAPSVIPQTQAKPTKRESLF